MNKLNIKKGDTVLVIAGKDKDKRSKVLAVSTNSTKIVVQDVNIVSKCKKAKSAQEKSEIIKKEDPIDASNVMVVCPKCGKATRVAHAIIDGKKVRVCKKCGASLDKEFVAPTKKVEKSDKAPKVDSAVKVAKTTKKVAKKAEKLETAEKPVKTEKKAAKKTETKSTKKVASKKATKEAK